MLMVVTVEWQLVFDIHLQNFCAGWSKMTGEICIRVLQRRFLFSREGFFSPYLMSDPFLIYKQL